MLTLVDALALGRVEECLSLKLGTLSLPFGEKIRVAVWLESGGYTLPRLMFVCHLLNGRFDNSDFCWFRNRAIWFWLGQ